MATKQRCTTETETETEKIMISQKNQVERIFVQISFPFPRFTRQPNKAFYKV